MRDFLQPKLWLGLWFLSALLCVGLSLMSPTNITVPIAEFDKVEHFLAYATLSVWAVWVFGSRRARLRAALALILLGIAMEFAQGAFTVDRMMDANDALANTLGVLTGQMLAFTAMQTFLQRLDRRLFARTPL